MTELTTANSYIVRIYRVDTDDQKKLTGVVENMDGSGERTAFIDINELTAVLSRCVKKRKVPKKQTLS